MTDTTQPPAETLAEELAEALVKGTRLDISYDEAREAADMAIASAALTRRAGGDAIPAGEAGACLTPGTVWKFQADACKEMMDYRPSGLRVQMDIRPPQGRGGKPDPTPDWYSKDWLNPLSKQQHEALRDAVHDALEPIIARWQGNPAALYEPATPKPPAGGDAIPAGWQLVPVELDQAMMDAGREFLDSDRYALARPAPITVARFWADLLAATPKPPAGGDAGELAAFGASDAACTLYPGENQAAERAAFVAGAALALPAPVVEEKTLSHVIAEAKHNLRLTQGCMECNAEDERRWQDTITWLEGLA